MKRIRVLAALLLLSPAGTLQADDEQVKWIKLDEARAKSVATGKPVLVFAMTDLLVDGPPTKGLDRAFASEPIRVQRDEFFFVKCTDMTTVRAVRATSKCELIFLDPDGDEILRTVAKSPQDVATAMKDALTRYSNKLIAWNAGAPPQASETEGRPLVVLLFASESEDSAAALRILEDRRVAKIHEKCVFVRINYVKDSAEVKTWNVQGAPTLILMDRNREFSPKSVVERSTERKTPREMKSFLVRGLKAVEKGRR
jgi:hypothetical protein